MAVVRKKQDDKNLKILRELVTTGGGNRQCFDCGQKGPTYVNMTIGSFVCTRCSGVLRGLTPPHRVKSISMATFTQEEIEFLKSHGNDVCAKTWLGLWDPKRVIHQDQRELMIDKYERKRYYLEPASPLKSLTNTTASTITTTTPKLSNILNGSNNSNNSSSTSINSCNNTINSSNNSSINNGSINKNSLNNNNNNNNNALTSASFLRVTANGTIGGISGGNSNFINGGNNMSNGGNGINGGGLQLSNGFNGHMQNNNNRFNFQNHFTSNENNTNKNHMNSNNNNGNNALMNGFNGIGNSTTSINNHVVNKNSLNALPTIPTAAATTTNSDKSHGFTPDSDFVADFGSANIFSATTTNVNPLNGFKIQSQQHNLQNNGISSTLTTMKSTPINNTTNGFAVNGSNSNTNHSDLINANENFADFDHAPIIYNAAAYHQLNNNNNNCNLKNSFLMTNPTNSDNFIPSATVQIPFNNSVFSMNFTNYSNNNSSSLSSNSNNNNSNNTNSNNFINNNLTSNNISNIQFENGANIGTILANNNNNSHSSSNNINYNSNDSHYANISAMQWNLWQQFQSQWPLSCSSSTSATSFASLSSSLSNEQNNGWSLPMSNSTSNSISSSATFNSNSSTTSSSSLGTTNSSAPPADRYAALKDLDEQLRESKASAVIDTFSSVQASQSSVNPFKTTQPPTQSQQVINPFQATFNQTTTNNIFGTPAPQQTAITNAFNSSATVGNGISSSAFVGVGVGGGGNVQQTTLTGFNNGFIAQPNALVTNNLNGCNIHYGAATTTQQITAGSSLTNLKNPFTTSSLNSNNPFL